MIRFGRDAVGFRSRFALAVGQEVIEVSAFDPRAFDERIDACSGNSYDTAEPVRAEFTAVDQGVEVRRVPQAVLGADRHHLPRHEDPRPYLDFVVFEMCSSKNGVAAREIERKYDLSAQVGLVHDPSAWFMIHRIREAMKRDPLAGMLAGTIVADETYIGGAPKNKHRQGQGRRPVGAKSKTGAAYDKIPVLSLVHKETGEVRSQVMNTVTRDTLKLAIAAQVKAAESVLHTDGLQAYRKLGKTFLAHEFVDHSANEYVRGVVSTIQAENFFSQLKRSIDGTHRHVSPEHLHRYLAEFDFRLTTKGMNDTERMRVMVSQVAGKRLTYKPLTTR